MIYTLVMSLALSPVVAEPTEESKKLLQQGFAAYRNDEPDKAIELLTKSLKLDPKSAVAWQLRATVYSSKREHEKAIADLQKVIELDPKNAEAINQLGGEYFKSGQIKKSITFFDRYLELMPDRFPSHWRRGISLYYAGEFDKGRKQFEGYEKVDTNDVENAVWHFLCVARKDGPKKARASILKIGRDRRIPMMKVYELYKGDAKPADVLKVTEANDVSKEQRNHQRFYAHLYLGLYYEAVEKDPKKALEHLEKSVSHKIGHYMWDVAKVHRDLLKKQ